MAQTNINIRIDEDLKKQFEFFCSEVGMNMTTAFCIFAKTAVREQRIPFEISMNTPNSETIEALKEANKIKNNENTKKYSSFAELLEEINTDEV